MQLIDSCPAAETNCYSGIFSTAISFRFSAKYTDAESGLIYYGRRYLQPPTGRWLSGDPEAEQGGVNLYGYTDNSSVNSYDVLGLYTAEEVRSTLVSSHGAKLRFLLEEMDRGGFEFKVEDLLLRRFDGTRRGAYVDCGARDLTEASNWALDALREWAGNGNGDSGQNYFCDITRRWASLGYGGTGLPDSMGATVDWLYLFSGGSSANGNSEMYPVKSQGESRNDLFRIYSWAYTGGYSASQAKPPYPIDFPGNPGMAAIFKDSNRTNDDQSHHFAAFFWLGGRRGMSFVKPALIKTRDLGRAGSVRNRGDALLGVVAAYFGQQMANHPRYIGAEIASALRQGTLPPVSGFPWYP